MRCKQKIDQLIHKDGRSLGEIQLMIRDGATYRVVKASSYDRSYLMVLNMETGEYAQVPFHRVVSITVDGERVWKKRLVVLPDENPT